MEEKPRVENGRARRRGRDVTEGRRRPGRGSGGRQSSCVEAAAGSHLDAYPASSIAWRWPDTRFPSSGVGQTRPASPTSTPVCGWRTPKGRPAVDLDLPYALSNRVSVSTASIAIDVGVSAFVLFFSLLYNLRVPMNGDTAFCSCIFFCELFASLTFSYSR